MAGAIKKARIRQFRRFPAARTAVEGAMGAPAETDSMDAPQSEAIVHAEATEPTTGRVVGAVRSVLRADTAGMD